MHHLQRLAARRTYTFGALPPPGRTLGHLGDATDDLAASVVDVMVPAVQARMPEIAGSFVNQAIPRVQERLAELSPQLNALALEAARSILSDEQVQVTVREATEKAKADVRKGFVALGALVVACTAVVVIDRRM